MRILEVENSIRRGGASLGLALQQYWPTSGDQEIAEHNIVLHVGAALMGDGWAVLAEGHGEGDTLRRDLVAVHSRDGSLLVLEAKRLFTKDGSTSMLNDYERILAFRPQPQNLRHPELAEIGHGLGALAATTHEERYARWFSAERRGAEPPDSSLKALGNRLGHEPRARWNAFPMADYEDAKGVRRSHWLVYVIFRLTEES